MSFFSKPTQIGKLSLEALSSILKNKNVLIVGGTAGIGKALAVALLKREANVTIVGRRQPDDSLNRANFVPKDLQLIKAADSLATSDLDLNTFDIITFSNGIITASKRQETDEKIELDLAISYLSRYAIAKHFKTFDKRSDLSRKPRVFVLGYPGVKNSATLDDFNSEKSYKAIAAHMNTVVGNEALVDFISNEHVNAYGLNPGLIKTEIRDNFLGKGSFVSSVVESLIGVFNQTADQYAENLLLHLLASEELENKSKALFGNYGAFLTPNPWLLQDDNRARVIEESEKLLQRALAK